MSEALTVVLRRGERRNLSRGIGDADPA